MTTAGKKAKKLLEAIGWASDSDLGFDLDFGALGSALYTLREGYYNDAFKITSEEALCVWMLVEYIKNIDELDEEFIL